jgi:hypothetical protein
VRACACVCFSGAGRRGAIGIRTPVPEGSLAFWI